MKPLTLLVVMMVSFPTLLPGQAAGSAPPATETARPYWVFFTDRGAICLEDALVLEHARVLPREAWANRLRARREAIPDERDLPLWEPYVRRVSRYGHLRHRSRWLNAASIALTADQAAAVANLACVASVRPVALLTRASLGPAYDATGRPLGRVYRPVVGKPRDPALTSLPSGRDGGLDYGPSLGQLIEINVLPLHDAGYSGNQVRFMMIDTGFRTDHEAFALTDVLAQWDFIFGDGVVQNEPEDDESQHNHGTATWGTAGAFAPGNVIGPGYGARFVLAKTEDIRSETRVEEDYYVAALEWADSLGVAVTNASLGYVCFDDEFCYEYEDKDGDTAVITIAIDIAAERGILCVNSQGNGGCDIGTLVTPADADSMLAVGAVDSLNVIAGFSACGPTYDGRIKPEVVARGLETRCPRAGEQNEYGYASGTSLSSPLVAGAAALLVEAHPEWGPMEIREAMIQTADRALAPDNQYGWGRIDLGAALDFTPVLYPVPFSLISPADQGAVATLAPTFVWRASEDPDQGGVLDYTVWIEDPAPPGNLWSVPAGADTSLTLPFALEPETTYTWWVTAEDQDGYVRSAREVFSFQTPDAAAIDPPPETIGVARLQLTCGPNPFRESLQLRLASPAVTPAGPPQWAVYDPLGRKLASGSAKPAGDGRFVATWEGQQDDGRAADPGVYYVEIRHGFLSARETIVRLPQ